MTWEGHTEDMGRRSKYMLVTGLLSAMTVVAACGGGSNGQAEGNTQAGKEVPEGTSEKREISILLSHNNYQFASRAPESEKELYYKELERLSGYKLSFEFLGHADDYRQQLALRFASGELADLVRTASIDWDVHAGAVDQGVFLELGPLIDQYAPNLKKSIPEVAWNSPKVSKNGKIYGIPLSIGVPADRIIMYRQDWLDKLNMEVPETLEDFLKFAEAVKQNDMNGDGDPNNEYAVSLTDNLAWNDVFSGSFGVRPGAWHMRDGRLEPDIIQPEMKEAIAFYKQMYDAGYIHKDFITKKQADRTGDAYKGLYGTWGAAVYQYPGNSKKENYIDQPDAKLTMAAPPKGPRGENYLQLENDQIFFVFVIPSTTKNPEEVIKFLEWTYTDPEADKFFTYGIKDHNYTEVDGKIVLDPEAEANQGGTLGFVRVSLNMRELGENSESVIAMQPDSDVLMAGYKLSEETTITNDALYLSKLDAFDGRPELSVGFSPGNLFYDTFVKIVMGREPLDSGFDNFVKEWKSRGGEAAIQEATEWYNEFHKK